MDLTLTHNWLVLEWHKQIFTYIDAAANAQETLTQNATTRAITHYDSTTDRQTRHS